jgi:hypothetical protein
MNISIASGEVEGKVRLSSLGCWHAVFETSRSGGQEFTQKLDGVTGVIMHEEKGTDTQFQNWHLRQTADRKGAGLLEKWREQKQKCYKFLTLTNFEVAEWARAAEDATALTAN